MRPQKLLPTVAVPAIVTLVTLWRTEVKPEPPLAIFVHLLDAEGRIVGQFDGLGANPDGLYPGDMMMHVHHLTLASDAAPGRYWLQVGFYNPETMSRLPEVGSADLATYWPDRLLIERIDVVD